MRAGPVRVVSPRAGHCVAGPLMAVTFVAVCFAASRLVASTLDRHLAGAFMRRPAIRPGQNACAN